MGGVILRLFQLVLGSPFKLTLDAINKSLEVIEVFLEEGLEVRLHDKNGTLVAALKLGPSKADSAIEVWGGKKGTFYLYGTWCLKIILPMLTKVVAIYVRFPQVSFWGLNLDLALSWL